MAELKFTQQQEMRRKAVREFVEKEVKPVAARLDAESRFPMDIFAKMGKLGFAGVFVPQQSGGAGLGMTERAPRCSSRPTTASCPISERSSRPSSGRSGR